MSYILDALRKAERERHGKNPQGIHSHLPVSEGRRSSRLALLMVVLLTLNLLLFGGWFAYGQLFGGPLDETVQGEEATGEQQQPGRSAEGQPATPPQPVAATAALRPAPLSTELPTRLRSQLPSLHINAHVYAGAGSRLSFVILGGQRLRNGEKSADGLSVLSIGEREVLLEFDGHRFRLPITPE